MKSIKIIFASLLLGGLVVSCTTSTYGNNGGYGTYGNGTYGKNRVYRAPDGSVYRQGEVYRDRNGNTYRNGSIYQYGNVYGNRRNLPPGQAKKVYGGSAKDYAYGQTKKRNGYYRDNDRRDDDRWDNDRDGKNYKSKGNKHKSKGKKH